MGHPFALPLLVIDFVLRHAFAVASTSIIKVALMKAIKDTVTRQRTPAITPALAIADGRARIPTPTRRLKRKIVPT